MTQLYSIDLPIRATAYVRANSLEDASALAVKAVADLPVMLSTAGVQVFLLPSDGKARPNVVSPDMPTR